MSGTIVSVKAGATIPKVFQDILLKENPTAISYAAINAGFVESMHLDGDHVILEKNVTEIQQSYNTERITFRFYNDPEGINQIDEQPFVVLKDKGGGALLVAFAEGDFPGFQTGDNSPEYHMVQESLAETIKEVYQENKENLSKTMEALSGPKIRKSMLNILRPRGVITLVPAEGNPVTYAMNSESGTFSWGETSRTFGYGEAAVADAPATQVENKPLTFKERRALADKVTPAATSKPDPFREPTKTVLTLPAKDPEVTFMCPSNFKGKERRNWIQRNITGALRPGWEGNLVYQYKDLRPNSEYRTLNNLASLGAALVNKTGLTATAAVPIVPSGHPSKSPPAPAEVTPPPAEGPAAPVEPSVTDAVLPYMAPADKQAVATLRKENKIPAMAPELIQAQETKHPTFSEQNQIPLEEHILWSFNSYDLLSKKTLMCMANEYRHIILKLQPNLLKAKEVAAPPAARELTFKERRAAGMK